MNQGENTILEIQVKPQFRKQAKALFNALTIRLRLRSAPNIAGVNRDNKFTLFNYFGQRALGFK